MKSDRAWIGLILAWAVLQLGWRYAQGPWLELDEAEALYFARHFAWGYNAQPPLYFWLQAGVFALFGENIFALALLKNALLALAALLLYAMLRRWRPPFEAGLAVAGLGLLPQILWEAQRALTHSVLAITMALLIMALAERLLNPGGRVTLKSWIALGLAAGLGAISKWNVALLPVAILTAALLRAEWRARLDPRGLVLALGAALCVLAVPGWWIMRNFERAGASLHKLEIEEATLPSKLAAGLGSLGAAWIAFLGLVILLVLIVALTTRAPRRWQPDPASRLMIGTMLAGAGWLAVGLPLFGVTEVADRWLLPIALFAAPVAVLWTLDRAGARGGRWLAGGLAALWLLAIALLPVSGRIEPGYRAAGFAPLASWIEAAHPGATVLTDSGWIAGNLILALPGRDIRLAEEAPGLEGPVLWLARDGAAQALAADFGRVAAPQGARALQRGRREEAIDVALSP